MKGLAKKLLIPVAAGAISLLSLSCASERWITGPNAVQNFSVNV